MLAGALNRCCVSAAWQKWQQVCVDMKFANRMGGGAIRRMLNRKLSMAWEKWQSTAAEMACQQSMQFMQSMRSACKGHEAQSAAVPLRVITL